MLMAIASTVFSILGPKIRGRQPQSCSKGSWGRFREQPGVDFVYIGNIVLLLAGLYFISALFSYVQGWIMTGVSMKITYRFAGHCRKITASHCATLMGQSGRGDLACDHDVDTVSQSLNQSLTQIITSVTTVIACCDDEFHKLDDDPGRAGDLAAFGLFISFIVNAPRCISSSSRITWACQRPH